MHGVGLARNQRLQRRYQQRRDYDRIDRLVWTCTVSAFATDGDVETVGLGRHRAFADHDLAGRPFVGDVATENGADALERTGVYHYP
jgi:hypothetical protein